MLIIFDLDYTLLDTENFKTGLAEALGLAADEFNDSYKKYFKDRAMPYNIEKHIEYLENGDFFSKPPLSPPCKPPHQNFGGGKGGEIRDKITGLYLASGAVETGAARKERLKDFFLEIDKYLFADAENALKKLKLGGHKLLLLTFGDADWQKQKVDNLKIKKYFDEIIYTNKGKAYVINTPLTPRHPTGLSPLFSGELGSTLSCLRRQDSVQNDALGQSAKAEEILIVNDNAKECLEIKKSLGYGEIFLVDGPYADNCEHNLEIRKLENIDKFSNR